MPSTMAPSQPLKAGRKHGFAAASKGKIVKKKIGGSSSKSTKAKAVETKSKSAQALIEIANETPEQKELKVAEAFMRTAAASALAGVRIGHGGPFGASIVRDGVVIACAHNMVLHCGDPTKHAEMTAIQYACKALGTHDLSDCDLYTTCEPCPMCWGAVRWSGIRKAYLGVDRFTAAQYGFDDKVFYDEVGSKAGCYGLCMSHCKPAQVGANKEPERVHQNMVEIYDGILHQEVAQTFADVTHNRTLGRKRSMSGFSGEGRDRAFSADDLALEHLPTQPIPRSPPHVSQETRHEEFMRLAMRAARIGVRDHRSKDREPFGAVIVKDGNVIAEAHNCVLENRDATATAEICAIRMATARLGTHILEGCDLYSTTHPDLMSLGAVLWSRISRVYCGVTQQLAAQCGFEEAMTHFKELIEVDAGIPSQNVIRNVLAGECEQVFQEWSSRNGIIY